MSDLKDVWKKNQKGPREKLLHLGTSSLSDCELLALFLRTGARGVNVIQLAEELMRTFGSLHQLISADFQQMTAINGIGVAKFTQLSAIFELSKRSYAGQLMRENPLLTPESTKRYLQNLLANREREVFLVLFLDNQHRVIRHEELFAGTISSVEIHPREIVRAAMKINATALILAHNHPSGRAEPSSADRRVTEQIIKVCQLLEIRVLDHLVVGHGEMVSFAERGWI
ncbi:RadC family protein [Rouxiella sp. Mn2063]|uniref:RadC family protein n=1 Tax=Rouxiella sp. Mn2063 TaxID=3395262 RepID=UPI003BEADC88